MAGPGQPSRKMRALAAVALLRGCYGNDHLGNNNHGHNAPHVDPEETSHIAHDARAAALHIAFPVNSVADCPGGAHGGWHYRKGKCYRRGPRASHADCATTVCPSLANSSFDGRYPTSTLACVSDAALNDWLYDIVGAADQEPGAWVGLYQNPENRKRSSAGWELQVDGCQSRYANWYKQWGEPNHHMGCVESCAVMGLRTQVGSAWNDVSCKAESPRCLCEFPAAPGAAYARTPPYADRDCGVGQLYFGIFALSACVMALAAATILLVVLSNRLRPDQNAGPSVGLFPSFSRSRPEGLYSIPSGFDGAEALAVNRSCRIVLQLTFATLVLGVLFKAIVVVLFLALVPPEHAAPPAVDLVFTATFAGGAAWLGVRSVRTRNQKWICGSTYLQAFVGMVWALVLSCLFTLLLMLLFAAGGNEPLDVVGVLLNVAFGALYATTGFYARRLQREVDALPPRPDLTSPGDVQLADLEELESPAPGGMTDISLDDDGPRAAVV